MPRQRATQSCARVLILNPSKGEEQHANQHKNKNSTPTNIRTSGISIRSSGRGIITNQAFRRRKIKTRVESSITRIGAMFFANGCVRPPIPLPKRVNLHAILVAADFGFRRTKTGGFLRETQQDCAWACNYHMQTSAIESADCTSSSLPDDRKEK